MSFPNCLFAFRAKFNGYVVSVDLDRFVLQVRFVVARGFSVAVAYRVASHFAFSA